MILPKKRDPRFITVRRGGTLQEANHHLLATWAADRAQHVLHLFEEMRANDDRPRRAILFFFALVGLVAACGGVAVEEDASHGAGGSGGEVATAGGAGGEPAGGGGACDAPPLPSPTVPDEPGCYANMGSGWVAVPCVCDLWLENTTPAPVTVTIQLLVSPPDQVPTLTGALDVEVAFDDPDGSWYATWSKQAGNGEAFTITNENGTTTVRMGEGSLALGPAPLAACETRKAVAHVSPENFSAMLSMDAVLDDGVAVATTSATCSNPPPL